MSSCGVDVEQWGNYTKICAGVHIGWGIILAIASIVVLAYAHTNAGAICISLNETDSQFTLPSGETFSVDNSFWNSSEPWSDELCRKAIEKGSIIFGVTALLISVILYVTPGVLGLYGTIVGWSKEEDSLANKLGNRALWAFIVLLGFLLLAELTGILVAYVDTGDVTFESNSRMLLIISLVGIFLTVVALCTVINFRRAWLSLDDEEETAFSRI